MIGAALAGLTALAGVGVAGCKPPAEPEEAKAAAEAPRRATAVEVVQVGTVPFDAAVTLIGETEANEIITVAAEAPGRVVATNYEEGQTVQKGQWLARVDASIDRTRIGQLQVNLEQAKRDLARIRELKAKGLATDVQLEQAQTAVENADYSLKVTRTGISKTTVVAPIGGIVDRVHTEAGEYAQPGAPLLTIVDWDTILVRAGLPESNLLNAEPGKPVRVHITALKRDADATIRRVGIQANSANRTFPLLVELPNTDHAIRPGMRADVVLQTEHYEAGLLVPREAVIEGLGGRFVFVVEGNAAHVAHKRPVEIGPGRAELVLVTKGLSAGEQVVVVGQRLLADGESVQILRSDACCAERLKGAQVLGASPAEGKATP